MLGELVTAGSAAGLTVRDATQLKPSLETVFLTLTGREYREYMTTTTTTAAPLQAAEPARASRRAEIAALIADAPVPRPTLLRTFNAMMAREFRVLRRNAISLFTRAVMQPLLFVFVFAYVFPKIGGGFKLGGGSRGRPGRTSRAASTSPPSWCPA